MTAHYRIVYVLYVLTYFGQYPFFIFRSVDVWVTYFTY